MRYYDIQRHWTKRIEPQLADERLNAILVRDFNKFTTGTWGKPFKPGMVPRRFETLHWDDGHQGPQPRYWRYVMHGACHWLVNFNLRLAQLAVPRRRWRIVTSQKHSTVWDGNRTLFEMNFLAFGVPADECFELADKRRLPPGKEMRVYLAPHFSEDLPARPAS